jgi:flagellar hook-length control protein FliK
MSATVSATSLTQDLQGKLGRNLSDRAMLVSLGGLGSQPDSFSRTLQSQLRNQHSARAETSASRTEPAATRTREAERSPQREAVREPERASSRTSSASGERTEADTPTSPDNAGPEAASGKQGDGSATQQDADRRSEAEQDPTGAPSTDNPDAAAVAGLPAAIAALRTETATDSGEADLLAGDSAGKSLQNAGLLPKTDAGSSNAGEAPETALLSLQGRLPIAAVAADKAASATQVLLAEGGDDAIQQPGQASGGHHGTNLFSVLRHATSSTPSTPQLPVQTPASQQAWAEDVGNQVRWMLGRAESKAELVLTPPNLGKLEVSIALNGDQTTAQFVASSQAARDALEQALPRLREILEQAGISLGQANVSTSEDQGAGTDGNGQGQRTGGGNETTADTADGAGRTTWLRQHDGLVDTFV